MCAVCVETRRIDWKNFTKDSSFYKIQLYKLSISLNIMDKTNLIDHISGNLFGKPKSLKSYKTMRNYLEQMDIDQLKKMLKEYK